MDTLGPAKCHERGNMQVRLLYMAGTIRSFIHYCQLRCEAGTQKEHREVALAIRGVLLEQFPALAEVLP